MSTERMTVHRREAVFYLARATDALVKARAAAERQGFLGLEHDLQLLEHELRRLRCDVEVDRLSLRRLPGQGYLFRPTDE